VQKDDEPGNRLHSGNLEETSRAGLRSPQNIGDDQGWDEEVG
jgi:hypothetical protein